MNGNLWSTENFTSLLTQIGYSPLLPLSKEQIKLIDSPPIEVLREGTTLADAEIKLNYIIVNLHGILQINTSLSQLYTSYKQIVSFIQYKKQLSLNSFLNHLVIFDLVFRNFNADFLSIDINTIFEENITVFLIEELTELPSINLIKEILNEQSKNDAFHKYLFLFFLSTMCHKMEIGSFTFDSFKQNIYLYNQFYISNLSVSIMIHIQMLIYVKLFYKDNGKSENHNKRGSINLGSNTVRTSTKRALSTNKQSSNADEANSIPTTFYVFFEEEIGINPSIQFYTSQNILKLYLNANVNQLSYQFYINIIVINVNYFIQRKLICNYFHPVSKIQIKGYHQHQLLISKTPFSLIFKGFKLGNLVISLEKINSIQLIKDILSIYEPLIVKADSFNFQEINPNPIEQSKQNIECLFLQWSILQLMISQTTQIRKKKSLMNFSFLCSYFKLSISKNIINKEVQLYFNYSHILEKKLFLYLKSHNNLVSIIYQLVAIITLLEDYKYYTIGIRISQTNFQSQQLTFLMNLITKAVINHLENRNLKNIIVYEKSFANYPSSLQVYIRDPNDKRVKDKAFKLGKLIRKMDHLKFIFLNQFLTSLVEIYDVIVMSKEKSNSFQLIRSYDDNIVFFILKTVKRKEDDYVTSEQSNEIIEMIASFSNNKDIYDNGLKIFIRMRETVSIETPFRITLIMDKYYLDNTILSDPRFKRYGKTLYDNIEDFYLIGKQNETSNNNLSARSKSNINNYANEQNSIFIDNNNNNMFNYDIFVIDQCISVINYKRYDSSNDVKYSNFINDFIEVLSDCIEFSIYVLKNKDIFTPRFIYIFRITTDDYFYTLNHKNGKIFFKRLDTFDSLINLSLKMAKPLFCLLSKKQTSAYTEANNNFFDVFLRLFLNLNKVLDKNESLNQVFFQKLHKNIFDSYYNSFTPIAFEYKAFQIFNDFFLSNDYLGICNKQKFENCYLIPFDTFPKAKDIFRKTMSQNVLIYNFNIPHNYWNNNKDICYFTFHKIEKIVEELNNINKNKNKNKIINKNQIYLYLMNKVSSPKIASLIMELYSNQADLNITVLEELLKHFHSNKEKIIKQKVDLKTIHSKGVRNEKNNGIEDNFTIDANKLEKCIIV